MEISLQTLPKSEVKLIITLTDEELSRYREKAAEEASKRVEIPGFRGGKAPAFTVESQIGKEAFFKEVLRYALPQTFTKAVEEQKIQAISSPRITIISQYPLKYEATVALFPKIKLKDYKNVKPPKHEAKEVGEKEISNVIREMQKIHAVYTPREAGVETGDKVEIDFQGHEGGVALENTKSKKHPLFVGEGTLVPGFEEQLVGMRVGERKKFTLTFPKNFHHAPFRGKSIEFEVDMKKAESATLPELDEIFIERITGQKLPVETFKNQVKKDIERENKRERRRQQESALIGEWLKQAEFELPPSLAEEEIDYLLEEMARQFQERGIAWKTFLEHMEKQKKNIREEKRVEAENRVRVRLVLNEIMRLENIQVSEEEFQKAAQSLANTYREEDRVKVRQAYEKDRNRRAQLINTLRLKKLFDRFIVV